MLSILRSKTHPRSLLLQLAAALPLFAVARPAHAHISVDEAGTHMSRYGGDDLKAGPCGMAGGKRSTNVYKYKPGATINVSISETIPHPGYFRIAFDNDGDDGFKDPAGTDGKDGNCSGDAKCGPGKEDYCNNETVLLDRLDQHASGGFGGSAKKYTWSVTLPNIECDNCTLQIIQVMNDFNFHPQPYPADDIYYQCIDIVLSKDAPDMPVTPVTNNGMVCKGSSPAAGAAGATASAGAGGATSAAGASAGAAGTTSATAGSSGSAAPAAGSGGIASPGAAGSSAAPTATSSAGSKAPSTAGAAPTATASGGRGAAGSGATTGSTVSPTSGAGTGAATPSTPAPAAESGSSGGCQAASGHPSGWLAPFALGFLTLTLRSRKRRRQQLVAR